MSSSSSIFVLYSSEPEDSTKVLSAIYLRRTTSANHPATKKYAHPVSDYASHIWTLYILFTIASEGIFYIIITRQISASETSEKDEIGLSKLAQEIIQGWKGISCKSIKLAHFSLDLYSKSNLKDAIHNWSVSWNAYMPVNHANVISYNLYMTYI